MPIPRPAYGTSEWFEALYRRSAGDPWGLDWRPSQELRFAAMLEVVQATRAALPARPRVLDFGCGTGDFTARLADWAAGEGGELLAVDASPTAVARARVRIGQGRCEAWDAAMCAARAPEGFDLLTCLEVLYYVPAPERAAFLASLARLLRPGGLALFSSMVGRGPYLSAAGLRREVGGAFEVRQEATLHARPLALAEKALMALARRTVRGGQVPTRWTRAFRRLAGPRQAALSARWAGRLLGGWAASHNYVLARKPA